MTPVVCAELAQSESAARTTKERCPRQIRTAANPWQTAASTTTIPALGRSHTDDREKTHSSAPARSATRPLRAAVAVAAVRPGNGRQWAATTLPHRSHIPKRPLGHVATSYSIRHEYSTRTPTVSTRRYCMDNMEHTRIIKVRRDITKHCLVLLSNDFRNNASTSYAASRYCFWRHLHLSVRTKSRKLLSEIDVTW